MDLSRFWQTLLESELIAPQIVLQLQHASTAQRPKTGDDPTPEGICAELVAKKLLSSFQAQVLLSGQSGPFHFGNYTISQPIPANSYTTKFKARHRKTQHPVQLDFLPGEDQSDLILWQAIEIVAQKLESIESPHLLAVYDSVTLPEYRFIVRQRSIGSLMSQLSGRAWRLPLKDNCWLFAQLADAIEKLHIHDLVHGGLHPAAIWIAENGLVQTECNLIANLPTEIRQSMLAAQGGPNDAGKNNDQVHQNLDANVNQGQRLRLAHYWLPGSLPPEFLPTGTHQQTSADDQENQLSSQSPSKSSSKRPSKSLGNPQLTGERDPAQAAKIEWTPAADWFQFGVCLLQAIQKSAQVQVVDVAPETMSAERRSKLLSKLRSELPDDADRLLNLLNHLLDENPAVRQVAAGSARELLEHQSGRSVSKAKRLDPATLAPFKKTLQVFVITPDARSEDSPQSPSTPSSNLAANPADGNASPQTNTVAATSDQSGSATTAEDFNQPVAIDLSANSDSANAKRPLSKNSAYEIGVIAAAALVFFSCLAVISWIASKQTGSSFIGALEYDPASDPVGSTSSLETEQSELDAKLVRLANLPASQRPIMIQELIADDRKTLWESPTEGASLTDLNSELSLPPAPKLIFVFRPHAMLADPECELLARSLGLDFTRLQQQWQEIAGVQWKDVDRLVVSMHSTPEQTYQTVLFFEIETGIDRDQLLLSWNRPIEKNDPAGRGSFLSADGRLAYRFLPVARGGDNQAILPLPSDQLAIAANTTPDANTKSTADPDSIFRFAIGHPDLVDQISWSDRAEPLLGSLQTLLDRSDRDRHFNFIFLRPALFSEEGQDWMGERLSGFNRELSVLIPEEILAATISLHFDEGCYLEIKLVHSVNIKINELRELLEHRSRLVLDQLIELASAFPSHPHWNRLKARIGVMIADLFRNFRWGVEHSEMVGNGWLPPGAAHNLMAGADLALTLSSELPGGISTTLSPLSLSRSTNALASNTSPAAGYDRPTVPMTLQDVLAIPRDLKVTNPPDLNLLLAELQAEINDEFPSLGGRFRIKLMGPDLQLEGITQNQRPGALDIDQQPLSSILTQIMISANPSKDISGPADPNCKLVWLIADDPNPTDPNQAGQPIVLVTTRAAAQRQRYQLPPAFQLEN